MILFLVSMSKMTPAWQRFGTGQHCLDRATLALRGGDKADWPPRSTL